MRLESPDESDVRMERPLQSMLTVMTYPTSRIIPQRESRRVPFVFVETADRGRIDVIPEC